MAPLIGKCHKYMVKPFQPKTREELKVEVLEKYELDYEVNKELVDKIVEDRYRDEEFKAAEKNKTAKAREEAETLKKQIGGHKPEGDGNPLPEKASISSHDKAYLYAKLGYSRTDVRHLEKVMKATGKRWDEAKKDNLFVTWKKSNDAMNLRQASSLPASRGGALGKSKTTEEEMARKFASKLPKGFEYNKPKK